MGRAISTSTRLASSVAFLALTACSSNPSGGASAVPGAEMAVPGGQVTSPSNPSPELPLGSAPSSSPTGVTPTATTTPADVTQEAAEGFTPGPTAPAAAPPVVTTLMPGVDYADHLAVARTYMAARLTYRFDDPAGYTAALTSPAFTTPAFATRSVPSSAALARLASAQATSAVQLGGAELEGEAPNSDSTRYVAVTCTVTTAYRGGGDTADAAWTVRLLQVAPGQWRVDGVLSND